MLPPTPRESIDGVIMRILAGVTCQKDISARIGDIVVELDKLGIRAIPGTIKFASDGKHQILDWTFIHA